MHSFLVFSADFFLVHINIVLYRVRTREQDNMGPNNKSESEESEDRLAQLERKFYSLKEECAEKFSAQDARIKQLEEKNHKLESCVETLGKLSCLLNHK